MLGNLKMVEINGVNYIDRTRLLVSEKAEAMNAVADLVVHSAAINKYHFEQGFKMAMIILFTNHEASLPETIEEEDKINEIFETLKLKLTEENLDIFKQECYDFCLENAAYFNTAGASIDSAIGKLQDVLSEMLGGMTGALGILEERAKNFKEEDYGTIIEIAKKYGMDRGINPTE